MSDAVMLYSFIHSGDFYSASSSHFSEAFPAQARPKKKGLREM